MDWEGHICKYNTQINERRYVHSQHDSFGKYMFILIATALFLYLKSGSTFDNHNHHPCITSPSMSNLTCDAN